MPGLAESWEVAPDGKVYTFRLRPNLKWSNGDPLVAIDIVESYRRILSPKLGAEFAALNYNFVAGAKEPRRPDRLVAPAGVLRDGGGQSAAKAATAQVPRARARLELCSKLQTLSFELSL